MAQTFSNSEFEQYASRWNTRLLELERRHGYYDGSVYANVLAQMGGGWLANWLRNPLYKNIKPLYLPLSRAVDIDVGIIPADWSFAEDAPDAWTDATQIVYDWSKWVREGPLYVHYGATYGVSGLRVFDLRDTLNQVIIKPLDPTTFMLIRSSDYLPVEMAFQIEQRLDDAGKSFEFAEVITPDTIATFKEGEPWGVGDREPVVKNELGFVPFVEIDHIKTGKALGDATYQKSIPLLNEVNELASYLADTIRKHTEPQWAILGAEATDLEKSGDNVWFFNRPDVKVQPIVPDVDISGVLEFVREIRDQVFSSLPELSFDELREKTTIATATLELQLAELVLKVKRMRPNYDGGLVEALRMAGVAGQSMGLGDITPLLDEALKLDAERPILPLSPETMMDLELKAIELERAKEKPEQEPPTTPEIEVPEETPPGEEA